MATAWCCIRGQNLVLRLRIQPRSSHEGLDGVHGERLRVRVSAAPVGGAANQRLIELLADRLRLPRGAIRVHRGEHARDKEVLIAGAASQYAQVVAKLLPGTS